jgi:hypothetical protein
MAVSLDHLVGAGEECRRQIKPNLLGCLCVDDELKPGRWIKRNFGGVLTSLSLVTNVAQPSETESGPRRKRRLAAAFLY